MYDVQGHMAARASAEAGKGKAMEPVVESRGRVKLFSLERGYGFIKPESGPDVYFLRANVERPKGFLRVGDFVRFEVTKTDKGPVPMHIRRLKEDGSEDTEGV